MTLETPLWLQNAASPYYPASADRRLIGTLWSAGVTGTGELKVTPRAAGANMSVDVAAGTVIVEGTAGPGQGRYLCHNTAPVNVAVTAAPGSGQSRIDLIVATVADSAISGASDEWTVDTVDGTPTAGTPTEPSPPASSIVLAAVEVPGGASSITSGRITDRRVLSGRRVDQIGTSVPPSFAGQVGGTSDGKLWVAASWGPSLFWRWANEPEPAIVPDKPKVWEATTATWSVKPGSATVVTTVTVPAPGFDANLVINAQASMSAGSAATARADYWIRTTIGGSALSHQHQPVSATPSNPTAVGLCATRQITAAQSTTVAIVCQTSTGVGDGTNGQLVVQVLPR